MQHEWSIVIEKALASAGPAPARIHLPGSNGLQVLLPLADYEWVRQTVTGIPDAPLVFDQGQHPYALLPFADYERVKPFFEEDPLTREEQLAALRAAGLRAGWNDPEWDEEHEQAS